MADPNQFYSFCMADLDPEFGIGNNADFSDSGPYATSPLTDHYHVDDTPPSHSQSQPSQTSHATTSTSSIGKRPRKKTSKVWLHFEEITVLDATPFTLTITAFLEMFYDATISLSGVYYPTSH